MRLKLLKNAFLKIRSYKTMCWRFKKKLQLKLEKGKNCIQKCNLI